MTRFGLVCIGVSFCLLAACSATREDVRANPSASGTILVNVPYKTVLYNFTAPLGCRATGPNLYVNTGGAVPLKTSAPDMSHQYVRENEAHTAATIDIYSDLPLYRTVLESLDLKAKGDQTEVTYYRKGVLANAFADVRENVESRATGKFREERRRQYCSD